MSDLKYAKFRDIPLFKSHGSWECTFALNRVLPQLDKWVEQEGLDLNPDFQRAHVWTPAQQSAWIEFVLRGGRTGLVIYLNNPGWHSRRGAYNDFVLVDGKQRIEALRRFFNDEIPAFGSLHSEFADEPDWLRQNMRINVNDLPTRKDVLTWYIEMNSGGTPHTDDEIAKVIELMKEDKSDA
jgi:uncharacterized protein with ParB-like and HNH nuclease domain